MRHLAVVTKNRTNPAYGAALYGATRAAARGGYDVRHYAAHKPDDIDEQAELIATALTDAPSALLLVPAHESRLGTAIAAIGRSGIPLVTLISEPAQGSGACFVGADDMRLAGDLAAHLLRRLPGGAKVAVVEGHPDSITTPKRSAGFRRALADFRSIEVAEWACGYYQFTPAYEAAMRLLQRHPRLDGWIVANDLMAMGVLQALADARRTGAVASINGTPEAIAAIREGRLVASALFDTLSFGYLAAEAAVRVLRGDAVPSRILLPAPVIDETNWRAWDRPYAERPLPDWNAVQRGGGP